MVFSNYQKQSKKEKKKKTKPNNYLQYKVAFLRNHCFYFFSLKD